MDGSGPHKVRGDLGTRPINHTSVEGGQAPHSPSIHEQGQAAGSAIDILQQIAQVLQGAAKPIAVAPQRSAIESMEKY